MLEILKKLQEAGTIDSETATKVDNEVSLLVSKKNDENKTLRESNESLQAEVDKSKTDLDAQLSNLDEKIAQAKKDGESAVAEELQKERDSRTELQNSLKSIQDANKRLTIENTVSKELAKFKVKSDNVEEVGFYLQSKVSMNEDGSISFNDGANKISVEDGFTKYFEAKKGYLEPTGTTGSGGGNGGSSSKEPKDYTSGELARIRKDNPSEYDRIIKLRNNNK